MKFKRKYLLILIILKGLLPLDFCSGQIINNNLVVEEQKPVIHHKDIPGVTNFDKVSDALYRGAQPTVQGFAELKKMGIKTIINLFYRNLKNSYKMIRGIRGKNLLSPKG